MARALSLAALTVLELDPASRVRCAVEAGYSHVSLRLIAATPDEPQHDLLQDGPARRALLQALADTGLPVLDVEILRLEPHTRVAGFEPVLALAEQLGARHLLVAGNDPEPARLLQHYGQLCDRAAAHGLTADLEFMPWTDVPDLPAAAQLVRQVAHPAAGVLVDAFHFSRSRSRLEDLAALPREWLHFMQLCDVPAAMPPTLEAIRTEARTARRFPGEGGLDLPALLSALPADLPISLEAPTGPPALAGPALQRAQRALAGAQAVLQKSGR